MVFPKFEYLAPKSVEEAAHLAAELGPTSVLMAGGTEIVPQMKDKAIKPEYIIDIKGIPGMSGIEYVPGEGLKIGALTKLYTIQTDKTVNEKFRAVANAAHYVASKQVRCKATMTGNICNASPSADTAPILVAMGASVQTLRADGSRRTIPMSDFFTGFKKTAVEKGEIVTEIDIPDLADNEYAAYLKHSVRKAMDLAIIGVAAWIRMDGDRCADCRIALGGVATTTVRAPAAEQILIGQVLTDELLEQAGVAASEGCSPITDVRASAEYRKDMVRVFTKRAIKQAFENKK